MGAALEAETEIAQVSQTDSQLVISTTGIVANRAFPSTDPGPIPVGGALNTYQLCKKDTT